MKCLNRVLVAISCGCSPPEMAWSVLAWRNSLVFHSLDKTTSLFIHLTPNILLYALRWLDEDPDRFVYDSLALVCVRNDSLVAGVCATALPRMRHSAGRTPPSLRWSSCPSFPI